MFEDSLWRFAFNDLSAWNAITDDATFPENFPEEEPHGYLGGNGKWNQRLLKINSQVYINTEQGLDGGVSDILFWMYIISRILLKQPTFRTKNNSFISKKAFLIRYSDAIIIFTFTIKNVQGIGTMNSIKTCLKVILIRTMPS